MQLLMYLKLNCLFEWSYIIWFWYFRDLEKQLDICETEKILLQAQLLDNQANMHCICNKVENQNNLKKQDLKEASNKKDSLILEDAVDLKKDDSCIIVESVSKLLH